MWRTFRSDRCMARKVRSSPEGGGASLYTQGTRESGKLEASGESDEAKVAKGPVSQGGLNGTRQDTGCVQVNET